MKFVSSGYDPGPEPEEPEIDEQQRFLAWALAGESIFLTGAAGSGKSHILREFIKKARAKGKDIAVTASTGLAGLNLGGFTVHRWAGIQLGPQGRETNADCAERIEGRPMGLRRAVERIQRADVLLIDEISMLTGRTFGFLDFWLRRHRESKRPFGGLQIILCGDFLQLPPVRKNEDADYDWAFETEVWKSGFLNKSINLEKIHRQGDPAFIFALREARVGNLCGEAGDILRERVLENPPGNRLRLLTHNAQVDNWCDLQLSKVPGEEVVLESDSAGDPVRVESLSKNILAPALLRLKIGARVMNLVNADLEDKFGVTWFAANGQTGNVIQIEDKKVWVLFDGLKNILAVPRFTWRWGRQEEPSFTQFPLRLAYALTIHKAQGMSLKSAHIDIRAAREPGQAYVALSRVETLEGLSLKGWPRGIYVAPAAIEFHDRVARPWAFTEVPAPAPKAGIVIQRPGPAAPGLPVVDGPDDQIPFDWSEVPF